MEKTPIFSKVVFDPQREDLIDPESMLHYLTASLTFYKRYSVKSNPSLPRKFLTDPAEAILSIELIKNRKLEENYEQQKLEYFKQGKVRITSSLCN